MKTKKRKTTKITVPTALALICCFAVILIINNQPTENTAKDEIISLKDIPDYSGSAFIEIKMVKRNNITKLNLFILLFQKNF